jgi:hypothetical protein
MTSNSVKNKIFTFFRAFFPLQLLFGHIKYNLFSLFFWFVLFKIASDSIGYSFGIPFLFYSPEYRGETTGISFMLIGFAVGGFTIAFHTYSYMKLGKKYPFIATVNKPFLTFCLNNSIIPLVFITYFMYKFSVFQKTEEFATTIDLLTFQASFLFGFLIFILISFIYFFPSNKNIFKKIGILEKQNDEEPISSFLHKKVSWSDFFVYKKDRIYIYLVSLNQWKASRSLNQYNKENLELVFKKTKMSSSIFELVTILTFILLGIFRESPYLDLPAGMSIIMLLTIVMMTVSAMMSWFYYWTYPILIAIFVLMNYLSSSTRFFQYKNFAYGLSYEKEERKNYNFDQISKVANDTLLVQKSKSDYLKTLVNWKNKTNEQKPKLIIVLSSGGGSRSALWTFQVLQHLDSVFNQKVFLHTQLITGASGGMVGAAYYRSLVLKQKLEGNSGKLVPLRYSRNIASDLLNKLSFSAYSNDMFFRLQSFELDGKLYTKDRGYSFEQHLNENTEGILNQQLSDFKNYEQNAEIPTIILSPTIVNDGRRLLISSQSLAFLCSGIGTNSSVSDMHENIDFQSFFDGNTNISFLSALRASATFPLVLPMVSMPTSPEMHLMDAGIRDNYGTKVGMDYLFALKEWISNNTSGVIILKIRDTKKVLTGETVHGVSLLDKFTLPFGNMYGNFTRTQDFDQDELLKIGAQGFKFPIDLVVFNLREDQKDRISLSWHLTSQEKIKIKNALKSKTNQHAIEQLRNLLLRKN